MRPITLANLANVPLEVSVSNGDVLTVRPGGRFRLPVVVANKGEHPLGWSHQNPLHLAYRWLDQDGAFIERDGLRTIIPVAPLEPGSRVEVEMVGAAPEGEGRYQLQLSLVLEGVHWACDVGDGGWLQLFAQAVPAPAWPARLKESRGARALRGAIAAAELARQLDRRSFDVEPEPTLVLSQAEQSAAPAPPTTIEKERQPVLNRLRDWLRAVLGVSGLERQLNDVLVSGSRHEQHVRELGANLVSVRDSSRIEIEAANDRTRQLIDDLAEARRELKGQLISFEERLQVEFETANDRVREFKREVSEAGYDLKGHLRSLDESLQSKFANASNRSRQLNTALSKVGEELATRLLSIEKGSKAESRTANAHADRLVGQLSEIGDELKSRLTSLDQASQAQFEDTRRFAQQLADLVAKEQSAQVGKLGETLQGLITTEATGTKRLHNEIGQMSGTLDRGLATIHSADDGQRSLLAEVRSKLDSQANELARLIEIQSQLSKVSSWSEQFDSIINLQSDLGGNLEALCAAQHEVARELREGSVVVELISHVRQLVAWAQAREDHDLIVQVSEALRQLMEQSQERALHEEAQRQALDRQLVGNSLKIDGLLGRQTIPLATAGVVLVRNRFGFLAIPDDDAPAIAYYSATELPEPATVAVVERLLQPGDCFLDVGANVGVYSLIAGRRVGPGGKVVSIEPSPSTMRALQTTLAINGIASVTQTYECALGAAEGTATLHCESTSGHNSLIGPSKSTRATHEVAVKRGDAVLDELIPALIKIDVEGWELDVLKGLEPVIKGSKRLSAVVEFSPDHIRRRGMQPDQWLKRLKVYGLKMWILDDSSVSLRPFEKANEIGERGVNLFLSRTLPSALKSMLHGS